MTTADVENPVLAEDSQLKIGSKPEYGSFGEDPDSQELIEGFPKSVMQFGIGDLKLAYSKKQPDISSLNFYKVRSFYV